MPSDWYTPSEIEYTDNPPGPEYPGHFKVRYASYNGGLKWNKQHVQVSTSLSVEYVGLEQIDDNIWKV